MVAQRLFVFSHPNHELAIFGIVQRLRPHMIFLTDGGGADRAAQTKEGLASVGLLEQATFLDHAESAFYAGLLDREAELFSTVAGQVREAIEALGPEEVYCDAVEFYNPVHDLALPIVLAALGARRDIAVYEVPLIYQRPADEEAYAVQRAAPSQRSGSVEFRLTPNEIAAKERARDTIYSILRDQLRPVLRTLPADHHAVEEVARARPESLRPAVDRVVRYEWRGALLKSRGEVMRVITYRDHYVPVTNALGA